MGHKIGGCEAAQTKPNTFRFRRNCPLPPVADGRKLRGSGKFRQLWTPNGGTRAFYRQYLTNLKLYVQSFRMVFLNRVYLHEYILTVADIFEAPPNDISSPTQ